MDKLTITIEFLSRQPNWHHWTDEHKDFMIKQAYDMADAILDHPAGFCEHVWEEMEDDSILICKKCLDIMRRDENGL